MANIYYSPEKFGLTVVAEIDYSSGEYEFDTRVVWKNAEGILFTARDSGCSCPTPFEDYHSIEMLDRVDMRDLELEAREGHYRTASEKHDFLNAVRRNEAKECPGCYMMRPIPDYDYLCAGCRG